MTWVKLCGLSGPGDVAAAVAAGADAAGFVLAPESPRAVSPEWAREVGVGAQIERFVVTVDLPPDRLLAAASAAGATGVQPHGEHAREAAEAALSAGYRVLFPIRVAGPVSLAGVPDGAIPILDTAVEGLHGGTGVAFDWSHTSAVAGDFVLAGGLTPDSVSDAIRRLRPWGVDVSSGVESAPGVKDHDLMRRFVEAAKWS
jgi:phosphoribosylanthranilate isomerase